MRNLGDVDIDSVRYVYYKDSLENIRIYYGQTEANLFDSLFSVVTKSINRTGLSYEIMRDFIHHARFNNYENIHLNKKDSIIFVSATYNYNNWKSMEGRIYNYLVYRYGVPNRPEGRWDSGGMMLSMDCQKSMVEYCNRDVTVSQFLNIRILNHKSDSIRNYADSMMIVEQVNIVRKEKRRIDDSIKNVLYIGYYKCPI